MSTTMTEDQVAEELRREAAVLQKKIAHEATIYATILGEVRRRVLHNWTEVPNIFPDGAFHPTTWRSGVTGETVERRERPREDFSFEDVKDIASTIYIQLRRGRT